jgi:hypothetical protein
LAEFLGAGLPTIEPGSVCQVRRPALTTTLSI